MNLLLELMHKFSFVGLVTLFTFEAIVLFVRSRNNKARKTMAYLLLMWVAVYLFTLVRMEGVELTNFPIFRDDVAVIGNLYIAIMLLFPIQVLVPGWLNAKRIVLLILPIGIVSMFYYVGLAFLNEKPENLYSYQQLGASLGNFNVWYRFLILLCNFVYMLMMLRWVCRQEKRYVQWKNDNYADQDYVDIAWMRTYIILMVAIFLFYLGTLAFGGRLSVICHTNVVIGAFSYLFYKALFYESPYPADFFATTNSLTDCAEPVELFAESESIDTVDEDSITDSSFENKIIHYTELLKNWMEEEKPYLYTDFKLTDVSRVLPLNRSYLSRIFNEGFGHNFSEVVRNYRVEYSKDVLKQNTSMPLYKVADISGFHSDSTFLRAFKQVTGMTPNQYRQQKSC